MRSTLILSFNEAAADAAEFCHVDHTVRDPNFASMRPRQMPRNFEEGRRVFPGPEAGFNEAAADAAEFYAPGLPPRRLRSRFNEAAADAAEFYRGGLAIVFIHSPLQ